MAALALGLFSAAPQIISGVSSLVHSIEGIFGKGSGTAKKAAVMSAFQGAVQAYTGVAGALPAGKLPNLSGDLPQSFGTLVDAIVAFYNDLGVFQHATPAK